MFLVAYNSFYLVGLTDDFFGVYCACRPCAVVLVLDGTVGLSVPSQRCRAPAHVVRAVRVLGEPAFYFLIALSFVACLLPEFALIAYVAHGWMRCCVGGALPYGCLRRALCVPSRRYQRAFRPRDWQILQERARLDKQAGDAAA